MYIEPILGAGAVMRLKRPAMDSIGIDRDPEVIRRWIKGEYSLAACGDGRWVWMNFPEQVALHDYRYLGTNFRERERIKRKKSRWVNRLVRTNLLERQALLSAIADISGPASLETASGSGAARQN